jgi:hypothetical protein
VSEHLPPLVRSALVAPEGEERTADLPAALEVRFVEPIVDRRARAIVLASRVDDVGIAEAPEILREGVLAEATGGPGPARQHVPEEELGIAADQSLGEAAGLSEEARP